MKNELEGSMILNNPPDSSIIRWAKVLIGFCVRVF